MSSICNNYLIVSLKKKKGKTIMQRLYTRPSTGQRKFNYFANRMNRRNLRVYSYRGGIRL